jgi:hypothetical protein
MVFGVMILLDNLFPTYIPLSKQLDLLDNFENKEASAYLSKIADHAMKLTKLSRKDMMNKEIEMELNESKYFIKKLTKDVLDRGLGLFTSSEDILDVQPGFNHMFRCLNFIYKSTARDVVEYPLSIRSPDVNFPYYQIIYRDLCALGYKIGTPNRNVRPDLYDMFLSKLNHNFELLHSSGVFHVDPYPSNIMYKFDENNEVLIKIIDLDVAHCIDESNYSEKILNRLEYRLGKNNVKFGISHDELYLSVYDMAIDDKFKDKWNDLASNNKEKIDAAFTKLLDIRLENN